MKDVLLLYALSGQYSFFLSLCHEFYFHADGTEVQHVSMLFSPTLHWLYHVQHFGGCLENTKVTILLLLIIIIIIIMTMVMIIIILPFCFIYLWMQF